jgi:hypothetical protein
MGLSTIEQKLFAFSRLSAYWIIPGEDSLHSSMCIISRPANIAGASFPSPPQSPPNCHACTVGGRRYSGHVGGDGGWPPLSTVAALAAKPAAMLSFDSTPVATAGAFPSATDQHLG